MTKFFNRINPAFLIATTLMFVSAFSPWFGARVGSRDWSVIPFSSSAMRPSSIALLSMAVVGVLLSNKNLWGQYLVGLSSTIWGSCCVWSWLIGAQLRNWLPTGVVPKGVIPNVRVGVLFGVIALVVVYIESFSTSRLRVRIEWKWILQQCIALGVAILVVATRDIAWASFHVGEYFYEIAPQSVPVFGEIYGICCLTLAISLIWASFGGSLAPKIVSVIGSILIFFMGLLSIVLKSGINWLSRVSLDLAGLENQELEAVQQHAGPQIIVVTGFMALIVSIYLLWNRDEHQQNSLTTDKQQTSHSDQFEGVKFL
jgi:hypothetical protein